MLKLARLDHAGAGPQRLLLTQRMRLAPSPPRSATGYATPLGSTTRQRAGRGGVTTL
jgi:hypothetical protein